jgi:hypothetical protein
MDTLEKELLQQVRQRVSHLGMTQEALAKKVFGEQAVKQNIHPYLAGTRNLLSTNGLKVLHALGIAHIKIEWLESYSSSLSHTSLEP